MTSGHCSMTKVTYLKDKLNEVPAETIEVHEQMMKLIDESIQSESEDVGWMEDVTYGTKYSRMEQVKFVEASL